METKWNVSYKSLNHTDSMKSLAAAEADYLDIKEVEIADTPNNGQGPEPIDLTGVPKEYHKFAGIFAKPVAGDLLPP
jgi:hypothetical protein